MILNGGQVEITGTLAQVLAVLDALPAAGIANVGKCKITVTDQPISRAWLAEKTNLPAERIIVVNS